MKISPLEQHLIESVRSKMDSIIQTANQINPENKLIRIPIIIDGVMDVVTFDQSKQRITILEYQKAEGETEDLSSIEQHSFAGLADPDQIKTVTLDLEEHLYQTPSK